MYLLVQFGLGPGMTHDDAAHLHGFPVYLVLFWPAET
jgi:hypothetical protein